MLTRTLTVLLVVAMMMPAALPAGGTVQLSEPDWGVVDPVLRDVLATSAPDEALEVIVQFKGSVQPADREALDYLDIDTIHEYHIVPAVWARATPRQVELLAGYPRVSWMEHNEELEYYMDMTTEVVNATRTWYSRIEGSLWGSTGLIDGRGVTVVVVDTGIDAGHPDLDYGRKTIMNLKSDTGTGPWYEIKNGDTSSGHGTHVAGTVAGNGDASAGQIPGMAPGANLIGLSVGEAAVITGAVGGLEWTYDHSKPGNNPHNIRVCTNSWGAGGGQYSSNDVISQAINNLVYENNVVTTFAAGNSDGDGNTIQSSNYGNTPAAICVAASGRDGSYITSFSSRGKWDWLDTWPDIAAPGHYIMSTAARRTQISLLTKDPTQNPYYLDISGTSMATPHVAGAVALLFQAAPSMRVSEVRQDFGIVQADNGQYEIVYPDEGETYGNLEYTEDEWWEAPDTRIHEAELILKLTADYIPPEGEANPDQNNLTDNYVPIWSVPGYAGGRAHDFAQGYGLINAQRAVGLALTLERIRWDYPNATVLDAYTVFEDIFERKEVVKNTDLLSASWGGEWSRFNEKPAFDQNLTRLVYVPAGADEVIVTLTFSPINTIDLVAGTLGFMVDYNDDGSWDEASSTTPTVTGVRTETYSVGGNDGTYWKFGVNGYGIEFPQRPRTRDQYQEARIEYDMSVAVKFASAPGTIVVEENDTHAINAHLKFTEPSPDYSSGNVSVMMDVYNLNNIMWSPELEPTPVPEEETSALWWILLLIVALIVAAYVVARWMPEHPLGRAVRRVATLIGLVWLLHRGRAVVVSLTRVPSRLRRGASQNGP